jgi:secreted trypsin-like serine protease
MKKLLSLSAATVLSITMIGQAVLASNLQLELKRDDTTRIIGGTELSLGERPWMVSLQEGGFHFCGGSLIAPDWVLTAAHCVQGSTEGLSIQADFVDLNQSNSGERSDISDIYVHPDYQNGAATDVALLKLTTPISSITPVTLATDTFMNDFAPAGTMMSVSGWGVTRENGDIANLLQTVDVPLVPREQCNAPSAYDGQISDTEICAGYQHGTRDSCQGDSGGPLVTLGAGQYVQTGIVSWGEGCALPDKYGVYARVASFSNWITSIQSGDTSPAGFPVMTQPGDGQLISGIAMGPVSGSQGEMQTFRFDVPEGALILWIDIRGGTGDADLMVAFDREPTWEDLDFGPYLGGNEEHVLIEEPYAGQWFIALDGYLDYDGVELMVFTR